MQINHNIAALNTQNQLAQNNKATQGNLEKLSSGLRINKAGDDAAGLAISEKMRGQIRGLEMAEKNAQDAISMTQTAEGALNESHAILQRMNELAVQSANDSNTQQERDALQNEIDQLTEELSRISEETQFNGKNLINGDLSGEGELTFHIGANEGQNISVGIDDMSAEALGVSGLTELESAQEDIEIDGESFTEETVYKNGDDIVAVEVDDGGNTAVYNINDVTAQSNGDTPETFTIKAKEGAEALEAKEDGTYEVGINISTQETADSAIETIQTAIDNVSAQRSEIGAVQNRLDHTINNLSTSAENLTAAESRIRDVDMASEMMEFTKNNILSQAAQSMLAQAQQRPQGVLQLLQ
ncbi:flagellin [Lentibacillus persicus]|uniref:Flagellin n=1 Tax=Lentibacillus persicus TaxID=640948 RepID=A0A1I1YI97_9BACI|nr:flagellin [Lentibacillus persicus]SFE18768.1 flagellin [Lentibacillus persicus]